MPEDLFIQDPHSKGGTDIAIQDPHKRTETVAQPALADVQASRLSAVIAEQVAVPAQTIVVQTSSVTPLKNVLTQKINL